MNNGEGGPPFIEQEMCWLADCRSYLNSAISESKSEKGDKSTRPQC